MNENESGEVCAAREAQEEIGFNVDSLLDPDTWLEQVCMSIFFVVSVCLIKGRHHLKKTGFFRRKSERGGRGSCRIQNFC